jgi:aminoglycoside N3'-acetyltransferase
MSRISRFANLISYGFKNKIIRPNKKYKPYLFSEDNSRRLSDFLASSRESSAIVFVGLKQVKYSMGVDNPFDYVNNVLAAAFDNLIIPTFTPAVLNTGSFDALNTPSENGTFSQQFLGVAESRTLCPFKSYAIKGNRTKEIMSLQTLNDYSDGGMYQFINSNDIITVNIGTTDVRFGAIHYSEYMSDLPYLLMRRMMIQVTDLSGNSSIGDYHYLDYKMKIKINRIKLEKDLLKAGIMSMIRINDLVVRLLPEKDYYNYLMQRLKANPFYLID